MLKTPKSKDVIGNLTTGLSLAGGAMASDGVVAIIPAKHKTVGKAAIAGGSFIGAAAIKGTSKTAKTVQHILIGMGVMQTVGLVRENLASAVKQEGDGTVANLVNGSMGLKCPGGCGGGLGYAKYPALMFPRTVNEVSYNNEFVPAGSARDYADFEELPAMI